MEPLVLILAPTVLRTVLPAVSTIDLMLLGYQRLSAFSSLQTMRRTDVTLSCTLPDPASLPVLPLPPMVTQVTP